MNFDDADETDTEMRFLPKGMCYIDTRKLFVVQYNTQDGTRKQKYFGTTTSPTKAGRFQEAMDFYKSQYYDGLDERVDYFVNHGGKNRKIWICPRTSYMTLYVQKFQMHQVYSSLPECTTGKPQWKRSKFNAVKELSRRDDSIERIKFIEVLIDESFDIVEAYRINDDDKIMTHTRLTYYIDQKANDCSNRGKKSGIYKEIFLAIYDKICEHRLRCEYSNIPMSLKQCFDWSLSIERLDNDIGYTRENILLVCAEFNTPLHWKPEHFDTFWSI